MLTELGSCGAMRPSHLQSQSPAVPVRPRATEQQVIVELPKRFGFDTNVIRVTMPGWNRENLSQHPVSRS